MKKLLIAGFATLALALLAPSMARAVTCVDDMNLPGLQPSSSLSDIKGIAECTADLKAYIESMALGYELRGDTFTLQYYGVVVTARCHTRTFIMFSGSHPDGTTACRIVGYVVDAIRLRHGGR
jgi:hypothetical protein